MTRRRSVADTTYVRWRRARQLSQITALALFLALLVATRGGTFPDAPPTLFFRFDPLALAASVASRRWIEGLALALATLALTVVAGRVWCGWLCPLGTVLDGVKPSRRWRRRRTPPAEGWRLAKYILLVAIIGAALAGNLTLLMLDPISLLTRGLASFALPSINHLLLGAEKLLYHFPPLQPAVDGFDSTVRAPFFPAAVWNGWSVFAGALLVAVVVLNWLAPRFWCRYLCPLGALLGLVSRVALVRRVVSESMCRDCLRCARACPTGTIDETRAYASDPAECIVCLDCVPVCPVADGQRFAPILQPAARQSYDPQRRQVAQAMGLAFAGAALYPLLPRAARQSPWLIRPPGAQGDAFLSACIRCSACVKVCPTSGLQPALWEAGLEGIWTPTLMPRLGYCDYSCNACGQVCPTGAIPPLALMAKRATVIGRAEINRDTCLPWSKNTPCIVCEEMCPLAPKAVELEIVTVNGADGQPLTLQRPHVIRERCIGCGICEYKCPVEGEAAIRIEGYR